MRLWHHELSDQFFGVLLLMLFDNMAFKWQIWSQIKWNWWRFHFHNVRRIDFSILLPKVIVVNGILSLTWGFIGVVFTHVWWCTYTTFTLNIRTPYRIYPKYLDTLTPYHICSKIWTRTIYYPILCLKIAGWVANSVDPDEMLHSAASHLGLHCLLRPVCPNIYGKKGNSISYLS